MRILYNSFSVFAARLYGLRVERLDLDIRKRMNKSSKWINCVLYLAFARVEVIFVRLCGVTIGRAYIRLATILIKSFGTILVILGFSKVMAAAKILLNGVLCVCSVCMAYHALSSAHVKQPFLRYKSSI